MPFASQEELRSSTCWNIYLFIIYVAFYTCNNISIKVLLIVTREMYLEDPVEITVLEKVVRSYDFEDSRRAASFENNFFSEMSLFVPWFFIFISVEIFWSTRKERKFQHKSEIEASVYCFGKKTCGNLLEKDRQVCDIAGLQILARLYTYCKIYHHLVGFCMILTLWCVYILGNVFKHFLWFA